MPSKTINTNKTNQAHSQPIKRNMKQHNQANTIKNDSHKQKQQTIHKQSNVIPKQPNPHPIEIDQKHPKPINDNQMRSNTLTSNQTQSQSIKHIMSN